MIDDLRQLIERAVAGRGDSTVAVVLFAQDVPEKTKIGIGFGRLDEFKGSDERDQVLELSTQIGGDMRAICIFRWPMGTPDAKIASDLALECDAVSNVVSQAKPAIPYRYCWGDPGGTVDERFVEQVAPRVARCREQAEMQWARQMPCCFLISIGQKENIIEWGLSVIVTPHRLFALANDDAHFAAIKNAWASHEAVYGTAPKAIAQIYFSQKGVREMAELMSKAIFTINEWSRNYEDNGQMCYWICD